MTELYVKNVFLSISLLPQDDLSVGRDMWEILIRRHKEWLKNALAISYNIQNTILLFYYTEHIQN